MPYEPKITTLSVMFNYNLSLPELIGFLNPQLTNIIDGEYHPRHNKPMVEMGNKESVVIEASLVHFGRYISVESAEEELVKLGLRPANLYELITFSLNEWRPSIVNFSPIVALDTVIEFGGEPYIHYLNIWAEQRILRNKRAHEGFNEFPRFLAFPIDLSITT